MDATTRPDLEIKCLIVEDDEDYVLLVRSYLEDIPQLVCDVDWEPDFDRALAKLRDQDFDLCFVDYLIGKRDGIEFIETACRAGASVPLILLTGIDDPDVDLKACSAGAADFLPKGDLSQATLSRTVRFALVHEAKNNTLRRRQAELEETMRMLEEQRTLLQLAMDNTRHGIAMFDAGNRLIAHNAKYLEIYGFSPEVVQPGMSLDAILRYSISLGNYTDKEAQRILSERLLQASSQQASTYQQRLMDGRTIDINHTPIAGGRSVTTCEDITESLRRRQHSAELARSAALADAEALAKSKFLSNMSHELRTPLNAIGGFTDAMRRELFGPLGAEQYKVYAEHISDSANALLYTVDQLLQMSLLYQEELDIDEARFDLGDLISGLLRKYGATIEQKHLDVRTCFEPTPLALQADIAKIGQAIENVLDNAVKFSLPYGVIAVSFERDEAGKAVIRVTDTGGGIPQERIESIFMPFEQEEQAYAREHHGAGLGLPIAQGLVRLHGGEIAIESELGVGTTVTMRLPAERVVGETAGEKPSSAA